MISELSILMPCYNNECYELVAGLHAQAESIISSGRALRYEIVVADDGSTDAAVVARNRRIDTLPGCRYVLRSRNTGRAAIRNFLARTAGYGWLLFIDSDMSLRNASFISNYISLDGVDVVYGGYTVGGDDGTMKGNLRYEYESKYNRNSVAEKRRCSPYDGFHTSNFLIRRDIMLANPFDERFRRYGYEDVLFGKSLKQAGVSISHVDNTLSFEDFETNSGFVAKTEEGIATLCDFRDELRGYSPLITLGDRICRLRLQPAVRLFFKTFARSIKNNLTGNKPNLLLFNIYKLGMYCSMCGRKQR